VFQTFALTPDEWLLLLGLSALIIPPVELAKLFYRLLYPALAKPPPLSVDAARSARDG
jgi:Ca2+-transporting ATPase